MFCEQCDERKARYVKRLSMWLCADCRVLAE